MDLNGPFGRIPGVILHYSYRDIEQFMEKMNLYSTWSAQQRFAQGRRCGATASITHGTAAFIAHYFVRGGFLDGKAGLISAGINAIYAFLKYAKLWEMGREAGGAGSTGSPEEVQAVGRTG
jgi:(heptosyl)LPS beta-1,4-glucosyltransferase